jgi:dipeptidyl aminopeptidase/acylaminoacyl peptidase
MLPLRAFALLGILLASAVTHLGAQGLAKKPLDHDVYGLWNRITGQSLSDDGRWAVYSVVADSTDGVMHVKGLAGGRDLQVARAEGARITEDSRFVIFRIRPEKAEVEKAERDRVPASRRPADSLGILDLGTGNIVRVARLRSFELPEENATWLAYQVTNPAAASDSSEADSTGAARGGGRGARGGGGGGGRGGRGGGRGGRGGGGGGAAQRADGHPLIVRNLSSGNERRIELVGTFAFTRDGARLGYSTTSRDGNADGMHVIELASGTTTTLLRGKGTYRQLVFDERGEQAAFLSTLPDTSTQQPAYTVYHWRVGQASARAAVTATTAGIPRDWWVASSTDPSFSKTGRNLYFNTAPRPEPAETDSTPDDERVTLDVWSWRDPYLQPMQLAQLNQERNRSYRAVMQLQSGKVIQLATADMPGVTVAQDGDASVVIGTSNLPYRQLVSWDQSYDDVYIVDPTTGERQRILEKSPNAPRMSPAGKYLYWYDEDSRAWVVMNIADRKITNVTRNLPHPVFNERHDSPSLPGAYGAAGWTTGDASMLVYDAHDIWAVDPTGRAAPRSITEGAGRRDSIRFRYVSLDPDEEAIDPAQPILLSAFHVWRKTDGFYRDRVNGTAPPVRLMMEDKSLGNPVKAENADVVMLTRGTFQEFPDLYVTDGSFRSMRRISDANAANHAKYLWGTAELVDWRSVDGNVLQGVLYKPENFDPAKKYPMMVYFYERLSDNLNNYVTPSPGGSSINIAFYVSRGYLVFTPDIPYRVGYPGESAMNAVIPGILSLIANGNVDEKRIGVQGHSWGGYQIAYMVTKTNLFAAAEAGAPVANMISAYGGIRWGTGMSRMFQYEKTQSRIGGTLWEAPLHFIENSPIFWADKVNTPLLMLHNDQDDAVPWEQGIEYFVALRRLGKPAWMLNYNGERHGLSRMANRRDWTIRMQQFFDHYLKGAPPAVWMVDGIPATMKGKTLGLELVGAETGPKVIVPDGRTSDRPPQRR